MPQIPVELMMRSQIDLLQRELLGVENELADVSQVINRESEHPELIVRAMEPQVPRLNRDEPNSGVGGGVGGGVAIHSRVMGLQPVSQLPDPEDELRDLATQCEAEARAQLPAGAPAAGGV